MSNKIPNKDVTYETAYLILISKTSPQGIDKRSMTYDEVAKKFKVSIEVVIAIKSGKYITN